MFTSIKQWLKPLWIALQFFTVLPVPAYSEVSRRDLANSVLCYPLVGLLIGLILAALAYLLEPMLSSLLLAALLLALWVGLTGALHLDGLADCADAWVGGLGSRERTLEIMKDPTSGPMAVVWLVTVLLVKFALLETLLSQQVLVWLIVTPIVGRMAAVLLLLTTRYVRPGGLGEVPSKELSHSKAWVLFAVLVVIALYGWPAITVAMVLFSAIVFGLWRQMMIGRLGGCTGDTAGAMIELIELAALMAVVLVIPFL
jgi:adenosylcobinamide-GDP ribazoletransferase